MTNTQEVDAISASLNDILTELQKLQAAINRELTVKLV